MASPSYNESIIDQWDYWCSFQKVRRNKNTSVETVLDEDVYSSSTSGMLRVGEKVSDLDDTYELVERTAIAFRPDLTRLSFNAYPSSVDMMLYFSLVSLTEEETDLSITAKPWANSNAGSWDIDTEITYEDIIDHYIPFNLTSSTYSQETYEISNDINSNGSFSFFEGIDNIFISIMNGYSSGIMITAENGYANVYGPGYFSTTLRPYIEVSQILYNRMYTFFNINTEIVAASKIRGVCRDREGTIITGRQCTIIVFDISDYSILGTGTSESSTGRFLVSVSCKINKTVLATFVDSSEGIAGSELMTTVSKNTVTY